MKLLHRLACAMDWQIMSESWLQSKAKETRVEFHGARMQWPVDKLTNEAVKREPEPRWTP